MNPRFPIISPTAWRRAPSRDVLLRKTFSGELKALGADRIVEFVVTTASEDRERDTINPNGWDTRDFEANPVIQWAHQYNTPPIGRARSLTKTRNGLRAEIEFATADLNPFADSVYRMVKAGFLNATSVGFQPVEWKYNETRGGVDYLRQVLLEISIVPVPANPEALVIARSMLTRGDDVGECPNGAACPATPETAVEHCAGVEGACPLRGENQPHDGNRPPGEKSNTSPSDQYLVIEGARISVEDFVAAVHEGFVRHAAPVVRTAVSRAVAGVTGRIPDDVDEPVLRITDDTPARFGGVTPTQIAEGMRAVVGELVVSKINAAVKQLTGRID